jgi:choline/glycine/proline betaine transport protein
MTEWRESLDVFFKETEEARQRQEDGSELGRFIADIVLPAFEDVAQEMSKHGRYTITRDSGTSAAMMVYNEGDEEFTYRIQSRTFPNRVLPVAEIRFRERKGLKFIRAESMFRGGSHDYNMADITKDEVIQNFIENYVSRVGKG